MQHQTYLQRVAEYIYQFRHYAFSLTKNQDDAHDLMHDTFIRAYQYENRYTEDINLHGWIHVMMRNIFINNYRMKWKRAAITHSLPDEMMNNLLVSVKNDGESGAGIQQIHAAMYQLDTDMSTPFMLHYDGYKYREISDKLSIPIGTIKSRIHQARKALQKQLV